MFTRRLRHVGSWSQAWQPQTLGRAPESWPGVAIVSLFIFVTCSFFPLSFLSSQVCNSVRLATPSCISLCVYQVGRREKFFFFFLFCSIVCICVQHMHLCTRVIGRPLEKVVCLVETLKTLRVFQVDVWVLRGQIPLTIGMVRLRHIS